jgi:hypothetical protein
MNKPVGTIDKRQILRAFASLNGVFFELSAFF